MRLVLLGDGRWAAGTLHRLVRDGHHVAAVVARVRPSDSSLVEAAAALGIPVHQPANVNAPEMVAELRALAPELGVSVACDQILGRAVREVPAHGVVNLHAGALPRYRGRNIINWAIINGEREIGITAHLVDEGIDTGPVLLQRMLPIGITEGYGDVLERVIAALPAVAADAVRAIADGTAVPRPQPAETGTYVGGREEADQWLDWSDTSRHLHDKIRAITRPGPGARTWRGREEIVVWRACYDPAWPSYIATPGQVVGRRHGEGGGVLVKTGDSTLLVQEVQIGDAPAAMPRWRIGTRLGMNLPEVLRAMLHRLDALERRLAKEERA